MKNIGVFSPFYRPENLREDKYQTHLVDAWKIKLKRQMESKTLTYILLATVVHQVDNPVKGHDPLVIEWLVPID